MSNPIPVFQSRGVIEGDPLENLPAGSQIAFRSVTVAADIEDVKGALANWDAFNSILLAIAFVKGNEHCVLGSGVLVAPGIALCASHVIEPEIEGMVAGRVEGLCQGIGPHGLDLWRIRKVTVIPNTDLSILALDLASALPPGGVFNQAVITTRTPKLGERLLICGFVASTAAFAANPGEQVVVKGAVKFAKGPVQQTHPLGRDRAMIPWPAVEVDCFAPGGVSGGPVFDSAGTLIGLMCSSLEDENGGGVSWVSLIWPALSVPTESVWPPGMLPATASLLNLGTDVCLIDRPEALQSVEVEPGRWRVAYSPWEE